MYIKYTMRKFFLNISSHHLITCFNYLETLSFKNVKNKIFKNFFVKSDYLSNEIVAFFFILRNLAILNRFKQELVYLSINDK